VILSPREVCLGELSPADADHTRYVKNLQPAARVPQEVDAPQKSCLPILLILLGRCEKMRGCSLLRV
jgi:hypothetical protein